MNRRGNVMDAIPILGQLLIFAMVAVLLVLILNQYNSAIQGSDVGDVAKTLLSNGATQVPQIFDFWFILLFVGLPLISAVLAYFNNIHPFFFWMSILLSFAIIICGKIFEIVWQAFTSDATIASVASSMPMTNAILTNYGFYSFFVFIVIALGTFIKLRGGVQADAYGGIR